jgi:hypothetical protein
MSAVYPQSDDVDGACETQSDVDPDPTSPKKRQSLANLDLPSFPRLS